MRYSDGIAWRSGVGSLGWRRMDTICLAVAVMEKHRDGLVAGSDILLSLDIYVISNAIIFFKNYHRGPRSSLPRWDYLIHRHRNPLLQ